MAAVPLWSGAGLGRGHSRGAADDAFAYQGDSAGLRSWAREHGWAAVPPEDDEPPVVAEILDGAPVPLGREHVVTEVWVAGHHGWEAIAFNVGVTTRAGVVPKWALTAVGRAQPGDPFLVHPRRLGRFSMHRGWAAIDLDDGEFTARWEAATSGDPGCLTAALSETPLRQALLGTDDGDDVWGTRSAVAAIRPDNHRPALLSIT